MLMRRPTSRASHLSLSKRERKILAIARSWIGTPYRHQARTKHIGCDCLGLVLGVWQELDGKSPDAMADYSKDWAETADKDLLLSSARKHLLPVNNDKIRPGDILLFRWSQFSVSKHAALFLDSDRMIHAFERHSVCEATIVSSWRRRISGIFRFPFS